VLACFALFVGILVMEALFSFSFFAFFKAIYSAAVYSPPPRRNREARFLR